MTIDATRVALDEGGVVHRDASVTYGLFAPFDMARKTVMEFIERDCTLPSSIAWIAGRDFPDDAFPDPGMRALPAEG